MSGFKINQRNVFLGDGVGAFVSVLFTGFLLPNFSLELGLSVELLRGLAVLPFIYMLYSLSCYFWVRTVRAWMLSLVILANLFYCAVSVGVIFLHPHITSWGVSVLGFEIFVVLTVVAIERRVYLREFPDEVAIPFL